MISSTIGFLWMGLGRRGVRPRRPTGQPIIMHACLRLILRIEKSVRNPYLLHIQGRMRHRPTRPKPLR
jgi:hypothetical protein